MHSICNFLDVVQLSQITDNDISDNVIENCDTYSGSLSDFAVVCMDDRLTAVQQWVQENCGKASNHICKSINSGKLQFAFKVIKVQCHINTFTEQLVIEAGGIQGFIDKHIKEADNNNEVIDQPIIDKDADIAENSAVGDVGIDEEQDFLQVDSNPLLDTLSDNVVTDEAADIEFTDDDDSDDVTASIEFADDEFDDDTDIAESETESIEEMSEHQDSIDQILETGNTTEVEMLDNANDESGLDAEMATDLTDTDENPSDELDEIEEDDELTTESATAGYSGYSDEDNEPSDTETSSNTEVDAKSEDQISGIPLPFCKSVNGVPMLSYQNLLEVANCIREAAEQLEEDEIPKTDLLTSTDKTETLNYLDEYSPAVFKDFMLYYVNKAETDLDYVRVTKVLDEFCKFISERGQELLEVSNE